MYKFIVFLYLKLSDIDSFLHKKFSDIIVSLIWTFIMLICPIILVAINKTILNYLAIILASIIIIFIIFHFIIGIFGDKKLENEDGFVGDYNKTEAKENVLTVIVFVVFLISSYAVLYSAIENLFPQRHFLINNPTIPIIDFEYYSLVTIVTLGYGDIVPISILSKCICISEIISGLLIFIFSLTILMSGYVNVIINKKDN